MAIHLDHFIVPTRDRVGSARLLAGLLGVPWAESGAAGPFSPVYVNDGLTLDFDEADGPYPTLHYRGHGCLGVGSGDFDGDGTRDLALLLEAKSGDRSLILAALARRKGWRLEVIKEWDGGISGLFIDPAPPGQYVETEAGDGTEDIPNAMPAFDSPHDGLLVGLLESSARAYFRVRGRWRYVQVSD